MAWTICLSGPAITKAGAHANSTIIAYGTSQTELDDFSNESEGRLEAETGKTYIDSFASLPTGIQQAAADVVGSMIAMKIIAYDTTGYITREADTLLNVHDDIIKKGLVKLKEFTKIILKSPV